MSTKQFPQLRECQNDAIITYESIRYDECVDETNISMCTGSGKSRVIYEISQKENIVIIAFPSLLLLSQYYNEFHHFYKETHELRFIATEIKDDSDKHVKNIQRFESGDLVCFEKLVVLTTYISAPVIYDDLKDDDVITSIDLVIHDEAHHIYAPLYSQSLEACKHNVMHQLNLSATLPEDCVADYRYSLLQGIKDKVVRDFNMELFLCTSRDREHGQVIEKMMRKLITLHEEVRLLIYTSEANTTHDVSSSVSTFLTKFAPIFKKNRWWIRGLNQDTQREKASILKQFQSHQGKFKCIVSCKTLSEGVDLKGANCMLPWDASKSTVDNIQRIGRVVRLLRDAKGKIVGHHMQKPSTVMIPVFVDYDKYSVVREDRVEQHKLLYEEIEQGKNGNFYPFVAICGALKSELLDDDEELFNDMIANFKPKTPAQVHQSLFECLSKILHKTPETLKHHVEDLCNDNENGTKNTQIFETLAEKENMTLNVYMDDDDTQAQEKNECSAGGVHSFGNNCENVINIQHTKFGYKQLSQKRKRELDVKHSIKHKVRLNNSDEFNILFSIDQVENGDKTNISQNTDDDLLLAKLGTVIECKDNNKAWYEKLYQCDEFYQTYQILPSQHSKNKEEKTLGNWIRNQRADYKKKNKCMTQERIDACQAYEWWVWEVDNDKIWYDTLKACDGFYQSKQRFPSKESKNKEEKTLGIWIGTQRYNYKNKNMTQERIDECESYIWWVWEVDNDKIWYDTLTACDEFYQKHKKVPSTTSKDKEEKKLGKWIVHQRENYKNRNKTNAKRKPTQERIDACEAYEWWVWEVDNDKIWYDTLKACDGFYQSKQRFPSHHSKNKEEKTLGAWIGTQRADYKKKNKNMTQERIQACEKHEWWVWEVDNDGPWYDTLKACDGFYKSKQKFPSGMSKEKEEKKLGNWINLQRQNYKKESKRMTQERIQACEKHEWWIWEAITMTKKANINTTKTTNSTKPKKSMTIKPITNNDNPETSQKAKSQKVKTLSKISQLHKTYKTMNSSHLHNLFQQDKTKWHEYHKIAQANEETFDEESIPRNQIIRDLSNIKGKRERIVVDMGCGMKHVANHFEANEDNKFIFKNYDHVSIDESVESCDISSLPLENDSVEICILCLAMWGSNCASYVKEAHRVLESRGQLYIIEATKRWTSNMSDESCFGDKLKQLVISKGFHIRKEVINKFTYFVCEKH